MKGRLLVVMWLASMATPAGATTMIPLDVRALTERADRVVLGNVEAAEARWTDDHSAIYTDVRVRVTTSYKGELKVGDVVVVRREGGTVSGIGMRVFGAASFTVGEEVVVFVERRGAASYVVGMAQGKLHVTTLKDGRKQVAAPDLSGIAFVPGRLVPPIARVRGLDELSKEIKSYARAVVK